MVSSFKGVVTSDVMATNGVARGEEFRRRKLFCVESGVVRRIARPTLNRFVSATRALISRSLSVFQKNSLCEQEPLPMMTRVSRIPRSEK